MSTWVQEERGWYTLRDDTLRIGIVREGHGRWCVYGDAEPWPQRSFPTLAAAQRWVQSAIEPRAEAREREERGK